VELKHLIGGHPRLLVKVIYILGNDAVQPAHLVQLGDGVVGEVGLGPGGQVPLPQHPPLLSPGFGVGNELLVGKVVGVKAFPDTAGTAEIGNPRFGTDAGAGEDHQLFGADNQPGYLFRQGIQLGFFQNASLFQ